MPSSDYTPTIQEVASLLRARTRDANGNLIGDFVDDITTPGAVGAAASIQEAMDELSDTIGADIPSDKFRSARRLAKYMAAANIELTYFPNQAAMANSMYDKLTDRITALTPSLVGSVTEEEEDEEEEANPELWEGAFPLEQGWDRKYW